MPVCRRQDYCILYLDYFEIMLLKQQKRIRRHKRVRAKISGTAEVPRLSVFRSNRHIWCQLINDEERKTILSLNDKQTTDNKQQTTNNRRKAAEKRQSKMKSRKLPVESCQSKVAVAYEVGKLIAEEALKNKIKRVVFDRGEYKYHGRVKAVAEGAREGGLKF